jgi:putative addiction module CopG family antidote
LACSKFIREKVKSGRYSNASEVVREALRRLEQEEMAGQQSVIVDLTTSKKRFWKEFVRLNEATSSRFKRPRMPGANSE